MGQPRNRTVQCNSFYVFRRYLVWFVAAMMAFAVCPRFSQAELTAEKAREAIRRAVGSLRASQNRARGTWDGPARFKGGATSLCTLALLNAGVPSDDGQIQAALRNLRKIGNPETTYGTSLQTMVFCTAEPERDWESIRQNVKWLEKTQVMEGEGIGGWSYGNRMNGRPDESNSQFALLALNEAELRGIPVRREVWERAVTYWTKRQRKDGSWSYSSNPNGKGSMTCAGISSLIIAKRNLEMGDASIGLNGRVQCCGAQQDDDAISRGLEWMGRNFSAKHNPSSQPGIQRTYLFYYLYGLERIGRLSGRRFIGEHDWYREGADFLIDDQNLKGEWKGMHDTHITTAMALLFLAKGQRPVVISKLTHEPANDWNHHRQDIGNLTRYIERRWKKPMTWQVIDHSAATVEDLLQSPVLFLSGRDGLKLDDAEKKSLQEYVQQGGFIFAEACCNGGKGFDRDFRALMAELFPDNPLRLLPPDHPVWYAEQRVPANYLRPLYGIDSCCRTSVVYCPSNLGCFWELSRGQGLQYEAKVQKEMEAMLAIGSNVVAYATNRQLRDKLDVPQPVIDESGKNKILRGTLRVAKLQHTGGSDDAPAALANLLRAAGNHLQIRVDPSRILLPATEPKLPDFPALFVHGRNNFKWSENERAAIKEFIENGGVIFGDSICASKEFAQAFEREIKGAFPQARWQRIPPQHPMFGDTFGGFDLSQIKLRQSPKQSANGAMRSQIDTVTPFLEGIEIDGRFVVIFSPNDISCALESNASSDCLGYPSGDAARLGVNILLYALRQ